MLKAGWLLATWTIRFTTAKLHVATLDRAASEPDWPARVDRETVPAA